MCTTCLRNGHVSSHMRVLYGACVMIYAYKHSRPLVDHPPPSLSSCRRWPRPRGRQVPRRVRRLERAQQPLWQRARPRAGAEAERVGAAGWGPPPAARLPEPGEWPQAGRRGGTSLLHAHAAHYDMQRRLQGSPYACATWPARLFEAGERRPQAGGEDTQLLHDSTCLYSLIRFDASANMSRGICSALHDFLLV